MILAYRKIVLLQILDKKEIDGEPKLSLVKTIIGDNVA